MPAGPSSTPFLLKNLQPRPQISWKYLIKRTVATLLPSLGEKRSAKIRAIRGVYSFPSKMKHQPRRHSRIILPVAEQLRMQQIALYPPPCELHQLKVNPSANRGRE